MSCGSFLLVSGICLGGTSLLAFCIFCYNGPFGVKFSFLPNENVFQCLFLDFCLSLLFFVGHSLFIRKSVKNFLKKFLPSNSYGLFYSSLSGLIMLICLILWQESVLLVEFTGVVRLLLRVVFILGLIFFPISHSSLSDVDILGHKVFLGKKRERKLQKTKNKEDLKPKISSKGVYGVVRHPLYLCMLTIIWCCPRITADRLLMIIVWTIWICIGTILEEIDLVREFGDEYIEYKKKVWMLVPYVI